MTAITQNQQKKEQERVLEQSLEPFDNEIITWSTEANVIVRQIIMLRREAIFHRIEAVIYILRMTMLVKSLRIFGHSFLNPIFVAMCGVIQASFAVFKGMNGRDSVFKLTIEDVKNNQEKTTVLVN